jgi:cell division septation protein DedD
MNKYYPVIARAVERLDRSTGETRRAVYERARKAVALLRANQPALLDADIANEYLALEEAIIKVEAEAACCLGSETGAEARSPALAVSISYEDKVQSRDDGQSVSLDRDDRSQPLSSRQAPIFFSASNEFDSVDIQAVEIGGAYGADHYHDEAPSSRWRGGFLVAMATLALALLAGTFAYRGMFGGDMPDNTIRNDSARRSNSTQTYTTSSSDELLQPDIREARKTPRIVSAIPISSTPSAGAGPAPAATAPALDPASDVDRQVAATVPPSAAAPVPVQAPSEPDETAALAPAAPSSGLAPVPAAVPPALAPVAPASSKTASPVPPAPRPGLEWPVPAANVPPPAAASMPVPDSSPTEAVVTAPTASTLGLGPPVPAASVPPAGPPPPASSESTETVAAAPGAREPGAPTPLGLPGTTAASVRPPASAQVPLPASEEPNGTAVSASLEPIETAVVARAPPSSAAPSVAPPASAPSELTENRAVAPAAARPALGPPVLAAASLPSPASAPASAEPNETAELHSSEPTETMAAVPTPSLGPPVLTAASMPPPASAQVPLPASAEPNKTAAVAATSPPPAGAPNTATPAAGRLSAVAAPPSGNHDLQEEVAPTPSSNSPQQAGRESAADVSSSGAYAVQLASERSAAEAHASFRALRSRFPNQLGGHEPIVRRTDLGAKGVYYRVMVGPFASMEKAAGMCGRLKTAGCNCLVQRN